VNEPRTEAGRDYLAALPPTRHGDREARRQAIIAIEAEAVALSGGDTPWTAAFHKRITATIARPSFAAWEALALDLYAYLAATEADASASYVNYEEIVAEAYRRGRAEAIAEYARLAREGSGGA